MSALIVIITTESNVGGNEIIPTNAILSPDGTKAIQSPTGEYIEHP